jgi:hypothetical protein
MKLYLVEIGEGHLKYEYLDLPLMATPAGSLHVLNKLLGNGEKCYPILNNNDHRLIKDCGGTIVLNGRVIDGIKHRVWVINIEHDERCVTSTFESQFSEMVSGIILTVKRDIKLESISKQL